MAYVSSKEEMAIGRLVAEEKRLREKHMMKSDPYFVLQSSDAETRIMTVIPLNKIPEPFPNSGLDYNNRFITISATGMITMWYHFKRNAEWAVNLRYPQVMYGSLIPGLKPEEHPILFIQSRTEGIRFFQFSQNLTVRPRWGVGEELDGSYEVVPTDVHSGFTRMRYFFNPKSYLTDPILIFPDRLTNIWVFNRAYLDFINCDLAAKQVAPCQIREEAMLMFLTVCESKDQDIGTFLLYGLEDSSLNAAKIVWQDKTQLQLEPWPKTVMLNEMHGSAIDGFSGSWRKEELCTPTCAVYGSDNNYVVVGTNIQSLFLFEVKSRKFRFIKKKRLINPGINCIAMHDSQKLVVTGGFDGMIRLFNLPELNQIQVIKYHQTLINDLFFVDRKEDEPYTKTYFLLAAAGKGQVTCWNLYPTVYYSRFL